MPGTSIVHLAAAISAVWLLYSAVLTFRPMLSRRPKDIAVEGTISSLSPTRGDLWLVGEEFDHEKVQRLTREHVEMQIGFVLLYAGTLVVPVVSVALAVFPQRSTIPILWLPIVSAVAWGLASLFVRERVGREAPRLHAHAWLVSFERRIDDPLEGSSNPRQDLIYALWASPHPDFSECVHRLRPGRAEQPMDREDRHAMERCLREFARRWGYRFERREWKRWIDAETV